MADPTPAPSEPVPTPVCPHCLASITERDHFCPKCAGPITAIASTDPIGSIHATGWVYINAADRPTRLLHVIGMWLLFGPHLIVFVGLSAVALVGGGHAGHSNSLGERLWALLCLLALGFVSYKLLWRTTRRYFRHRRERDGLASHAG